MNNLKKLGLLLTRQQKKQLGWLLLPMSITALFNIVGIAFIMPFLAVISDPNLIHTSKKIGFAYHFFGFTNTLHFTIFLGCLAFLILVFANSFSVLTTWFSAKVVAKTSANLKQSLYKKYLHQPYEFYLTTNTSNLISNLFVLVPNICEGYVFQGVQMIASLISITAICTLILVINPYMALVLGAVFGGIYYFLFKSIKRRIAINSLGIVSCDQGAQKLANETFGGIKDVKLKSSEQLFRGMFDAFLVKSSVCKAFNQAAGLVPKYLLELVAFGGVILMIVIMLLAGSAVTSIIPILALYVYAGYRLMPALQQVFVGLTQMKAVSADIDTVYNSFYSQTTSEAVVELPAQEVAFQSSIDLRQISYAYPGSSKNVLDSLELSIRKNEVIGIIGSTGAGKTTLIDILLGLIAPTKGSLSIDNEVLQNAQQLVGWRSKVGYVPQHIFLADTSIKNNISFGLPSDMVCDEKIGRAAKLAAISGFIESELPDGYDTIVGERGVRLSGGQIQRIGIARALYRNPEVLLLDEATSALDGKTEAGVMRAIYAMRNTLTVVIVAHRLSTLSGCDHIYEIDTGRALQRAEEGVESA